MGEVDLVVLALGLVAYALVSRRLEASGLTGPMIFMAIGLALGAPTLAGLDALLGAELLKALLEITLVLILFTDAFELDLGAPREALRLPARLLGLGLPLMILIGWGVALGLLTGLSVAAALLVAVLLAPTDAALGAPVVSNPTVPERIRNALNIESGLNDGLALPIFFVVLDVASTNEMSGGLGRAILVQVAVAVLVGAAVGAATARLADVAVRREWTSGPWVEIALVSTAVGAWALADKLGASGFIAAWVAGFACRRVTRLVDRRRASFSTDLGDALMLVSFGLFGAIALAPSLSRMTPEVVGYAVLSLLLIRPLAVGLATIGLGLRWPTRLYLGWFGPRGLASVILVLVVVVEGSVPGSETIVDITAATVGLSVLLHGATAWWGSSAYGAWSRRSSEPPASGDSTASLT